MASKKVTGKQVKDFWRYMSKRHGFKVVQKSDAAEMKAISWFLDSMGIVNSKEFMEKYTVTLGTTVYVNFKIGKGNQRSLVSQVKTCVHETQHVIQYRRNPARFVYNYANSDAARTHYEVDAYRTDMEMHYYFYGKVLKPAKLANKLKGYSVGKGDIHVARKHLLVSSKVVKHGVIVSGISKDAIRWWRKRKVKGSKVVFAA